MILNFDSTRVKVSLDAIERNFDAVREKAGVPVMAVVKADAYGHGAVPVARLLAPKCGFFGVSSCHFCLQFSHLLLVIVINRILNWTDGISQAAVSITTLPVLYHR